MLDPRAKKKTKRFWKYCGVCRRRFTSKFCLELHLNKHKENAGKPKRYKCDFCFKQFQEMANFVLHRKLHHHTNDKEKIRSLNSAAQSTSGIDRQGNGPEGSPSPSGNIRDTTTGPENHANSFGNDRVVGAKRRKIVRPGHSSREYKKSKE